MSSNLLKEKVSGLLSAAGITTAGSYWASKALHPSDEVTGVAGIPTKDCLPSASVSYTCTYVITPPTEVTGTDLWDCSILTGCHPLYFGKVIATGFHSSSQYTKNVQLYNTQLGVTIYDSDAAIEKETNRRLISQWSSLTRLYRPTFQGVTASLTAPSLSDQGTVAAAQYPIRPTKWDSGSAILAATALTSKGLDAIKNSNTIVDVWRRPIISYQSGHQTFSSLQGLPGSYVGHAKEGAYLPYKLDDSCFKYRSSNELKLINSCLDVDTAGTVRYPFKVQENIDEQQFANNGPNPLHPDSVSYLGNNRDSSILTSTLVGIPNAVAVLDYSSDNFSHVYFKGISAAATVSITVRIGFECIVPPTSILVPSVLKPISYDPVAIEGYFKISREMAAAYPDRFNFLGTLWNVVKGIGSRVLPHVVSAVSDTVNPPKPQVIEKPQYYQRPRIQLPKPTEEGRPTPKPKRRIKRTKKQANKQT